MTLTLITLMLSTGVLFASGWWRGIRRELPVTAAAGLGLAACAWWLAQPDLDLLSAGPAAWRGWRPVLQPFSLPVGGGQLVMPVADSVPALAAWIGLIAVAYWLTGRGQRKDRRSPPARRARLAGALLATANGFAVWWMALPAMTELTPPAPEALPSLGRAVDMMRTVPGTAWQTAALPGRLAENWINIATPAAIALAVYLMSRKSRPRRRKPEPEVVIRT